jgi:hypothetical protein
MLVILMGFMLASNLGPVDRNQVGLAPNALSFGNPIVMTQFQEFPYTIKSRTTELHSTCDLQCTRDRHPVWNLVSDRPASCLRLWVMAE